MVATDKDRLSGIELLRILAMAGVVILHYNSQEMGGGFRYMTEGSANQYFLFFTENLSICAVNIFVMVSAYFLSVSQKRKFMKVLELVIQVILFQEGFYFAGIVLGTYVFSVKTFLLRLLPLNYFVVLYGAMYLVSPYLNVLIKGLSKKNFQKLLVLLLLLFSVWTIFVDLLESLYGAPLEGLSTVGAQGSQNGYSIVNFLLIYFVGAYLRQYGVERKSGQLFAMGAAALAVLYVGSLVEHFCGFSSVVTWHYNNPVAILFSAVVLALFTRVRFSSKIVNELAKGGFTCFLFHGAFLGYLGIERFVRGNVFVMALHQIGTVCGLYLLSYVAYKIYALCTGWLMRRLAPVVNKIELFDTES